MYTSVNIHTFREAFNRMGRGNQFTYEGLGVLFYYLKDLEFCEKEHELDVIAFCSDFAEDTPQEIANAYSIELPNDAAIFAVVSDYLNCEGVLVGETDTTIVYRQF